MITKEDLIRKAYDICEEQNCTLIYLVYSGSRLYGTTTPSSDIDISGIFLPSKAGLLLGEKTTYIKYESKKDNERNSHDDFEIKLHSLQYFLKYLLLKCDTGALDLLFSHTNQSNILVLNAIRNNKNKKYGYNIIQKITHSKPELFEIPNIQEFSYVDFAVSQAKKYGIRGNRLRVVKKVLDYFNLPKFTNVDRTKMLENTKLIDCVDELMAWVGDNEYIDKNTTEFPGYLILTAKKHMLTISLFEFINRVQLEMNRYGDRSLRAEINDGNDWKALSHSIRGIYQMEELCTTGQIIFPLNYAELLREVKIGKYSIQEIEKLINDGMDRLNEITLEMCKFIGKRNEGYVNQLIWDAYS